MFLHVLIGGKADNPLFTIQCLYLQKSFDTAPNPLMRLVRSSSFVLQAAHDAEMDLQELLARGIRFDSFKQESQSRRAVTGTLNLIRFQL